jgi:hypothetical protein
VVFLFQTRNNWIWESAIYFAFIFVAIILLASLYFFPQFNFASLFILVFLIPTFIFFNHYQKINKMIGVLKGCISAQNGEVVASLLYFRNKAIPGIAILRDNVIILIPIFGRRHKIFFDKFKSVKEVNKMPGKWLLDKHVFNIEFETKPPVLFAVPDSVGKRWAVVFQSIN